jgi:hypothetical protein
LSWVNSSGSMSVAEAGGPIALGQDQPRLPASKCYPAPERRPGWLFPQISLHRRRRLRRRQTHLRVSLSIGNAGSKRCSSRCHCMQAHKAALVLSPTPASRPGLRSRRAQRDRSRSSFPPASVSRGSRWRHTVWTAHRTNTAAAITSASGGTAPRCDRRRAS